MPRLKHKLTSLIIAIAFTALMVYDVIAAIQGWATITQVIQSWPPAVAVWFGFLMGHLFGDF